MNTQRISTVAVLLASVIAMPSFAAVKPGSAPQRATAPAASHAATTASKPAAHAMKADGVLSAVDATAKSITVKGKDHSWTFSAGTAAVTSKGKPITLSDLKVGEKVEVHYSGSGTSLTATAIAVVG